MKNPSTKKLVLAALFLALAYLLPFLTGQIPEIGSMLLPWLALWAGCRFYCAVAAVFYPGNAALLPHRDSHGF